jgi:hypothetical protein
MEPNRQAKIASSLPVFGMLAIIGLAFYVSQRPLKSSRPEAPAGLRQLTEEEDKIDARLWQDPLKVVLDHEKVMLEEKVEGSDSYREYASMHDVNTVSEEIGSFLNFKRDIPIVQVLLVMVRGGVSAEDHERRLRNRYAMLTALHSSGFFPDESKHIRYFRLPWTKKEQLSNAKKVPKIGKCDNKSSKPLVFPFEWFGLEKLVPDTSVDSYEDRPERVLVIWLAESAFSAFPLTRLAQVINALGNTSNSNLQVDVIGPSHSGTLQTMLSEIDSIDDSKGKFEDSNYVNVGSVLERRKIYSPWATVSPALLVKDWPAKYRNCQNSISGVYEVIQNEFERIGLEFVRMIGSDDLLAMHLINELRRRGVNVLPDPNGFPDHVALISEWDLFYGKAFPMTFATMMEMIDPNWNEYTIRLHSRMRPYGPKLPENLHTYNYIQGIDGRLPESEASNGKQTNEDRKSESKWTYLKSPELATGRSQLDYIRRLAQMLDEEHEVKAFGVVGTDVYDKLLLFQALREQLGDIILFTVDMDARMLHQEQLRWTRNVIVASNYALELNCTYQHGSSTSEYAERSVPPFRDNYQTALFFACRTALGLDSLTSGLFCEMDVEELTEFISHPRLFEIGRGRPVDISVDDAGIHPPRHNLITDRTSFKEKYPLKTTVLIVAAIASCVLLLFQLGPGRQKAIVPRRPRDGPKKPEKNPKDKPKENRPAVPAWIMWLLVAAVIGFAITAMFDHYRSKGEPFSLFTGVSIWPGEALRLVAVILSVYFITKSLRDLEINEKELCKEFKLHELRIKSTKWRKMKKRLKRWTKRRGGRFSLKRWIGIHGYKTNKTTVDAQRLWKRYFIRGIGCNRFHRLILMSLAYVGLAAALMFIFGLPQTPYRGIISLCVDKVLLALSVISMIILIFFVVDATRLSIWLIRNLKDPHTIWPPELIRCFKARKDENSREAYGHVDHSTESAKDSEDDSAGESDGLAEWLDVKFIASHTEATGKLIYWPFIVLLIMFVARNRYFDNWDFPIPLIIIFLLNSTCALCCAWMLRREAEKTRRVALDRLGKELVEATGAGDKCRTKQLETMTEQIKSVRRGAYSPFTENPVLHAILIPSGGVSLLTLLRFLVPS